MDTDPTPGATPDTKPAPAAGRLSVLATGPQLRDLAAAASCACACHPRPADLSLHDGGARCGCQLTTEERTQTRREALEGLLALTAEFGLDAADEAEAVAFDEAAAELAVLARIRVRACPLVVTGTVDGCSFFFRERHGTYRVEIPADGADVDLYDDYDHPTLRVADGLGHLTPAEALRLSVTRVRAHLLAADCGHRDARAFCPDCGTPAG